LKEFDPNFILGKYGANVLGEDIVFFPSLNCKRLVVCFSAMDIKNKFNRLSWFWDPLESWKEGTSFLYLCDPEYKYYIGDDSSPKFHKFEKIVKHYANKCGVDLGEIYTVGSSMGGYAAILFAFRLQLGGAVVGVPQVSKNYARMHNFSNWIKSMNNTENQWIDLGEFLYRTDFNLPNLYLEYGNYPADRFAAEKLIDIYRDRGGTCIVRKYNGTEHEYFMSRSVVLSAVDFFSIKPSIK